MFNFFIKEFNLLKRDLFGLLILFLMPSILLIVITCVQNVNYKNAAVKPAKILLVNNDKDVSNENFLSKNKTGNVIFIDKLKDKKITIYKAKELLISGKYDAALYIPKNSAKDIGNHFENLFRYEKVLSIKNKMLLYFSQNINPLLAKSIEETFKTASIQTQMYFLKLNIFKELDKYPPKHSLKTNSWLETKFISANKSYSRPNTIQQNVPAWALFGMFFIVVPLASTFIQERKSSVMQRLRTTSMKSYNFIFSKFAAYVFINMVQLFLMFIIGIYLLPELGIPKLVIVGKTPLLILIGLFCSFAATSFGLLIGSIAKTQQQASMLGPVLIVIAAAIGGIMVPVFLMPPALQRFCDLSPLYWGQQAFLKILVYNQNINSIYPELIKLFIFFIVCFITSWALFLRKKI